MSKATPNDILRYTHQLDNTALATSVKKAIQEEFDIELNSCKAYVWSDDVSITVRIFLDNFNWLSRWYPKEAGPAFIVQHMIHEFRVEYSHLLKRKG